jgi:hypothetical protein
MKPELDFAIELELRRVPTMNRTELVSFIELLVDNNRRTYGLLAEFQSIAEEQTQVIQKLVSIKEKLEIKVECLDDYIFSMESV